MILKDRAIDLARSLRTMLQSPLEELLVGLKTLQAMVGVVGGGAIQGWGYKGQEGYKSFCFMICLL